MNCKALRGMKDALPDSSGLWQSLEAAAKALFGVFGYREIRTPVLEEKALFVKSIGDATDIVSKEMFSFQDRGERDIALRPEGTAPIVRAYLEGNLHKTEPFQKLYYIGPMFRAERPQAGRMRQFHQIGAEAIGSENPALDAEQILLMASILDRCNVKNYSIRLNNLGCSNDKVRLSQMLRDMFSEKKILLCDDCKKRLVANPLRVIDCKKESCRDIVRGTLKALDFLCAGCKDHYAKVKSYLSMTDVSGRCVDDPYIVRGLDYYTRTVFEISHGALGAQDSIGAGGRYDNLIKDMGGPQLGAVGFAIGVERLLMAQASENPPASVKEPVVWAYVATIGEAAYAEGYKVMNALRTAGIGCDIDYEGKSLKAVLRVADKVGAPFVVIMGDDELRQSSAIVRNMRTKEQFVYKATDLVMEISKKISDLKAQKKG